MLEGYARESVRLCTLPVRLVTLRLSIRRMIKKQTNLLYLSRFATGRPELVFFRLCSRRVAETSDMVCYADCPHVCDDEESHHEDLGMGWNLTGVSIS